MSIVKLFTDNFRNLEQDTAIKLHPKLNFVIGKNGSGKSSFLEAIFYLGHGKSFRSPNAANLVNYDKSDFVVSAIDDNEQKIGIKKDIKTDELIIKIDQEKKYRLADLVKGIPVQIVTPESFKLFFGGPKERRRFFDLGLFHVEHTFSESWKTFSRLLRQRNACLKNRSNDIEYWTGLFCESSVVIADSRERYIQQLTDELKNWLTLLLPNIASEVTVQYFRGWNSKKALHDILLEYKEREIIKGYSQAGPQKFDVRILHRGLPIENSLSRGQQKLFLLALTLAQSKLIEKVKQVKPILLIDDVGAELDAHSRGRLAEALNSLESQVIISAIEKNVLDNLIPTDNNFKMFHVEHGKLSAMSE